MAKYYRKKSGGLDKFLSVVLYITAAICVTLGAIVLIRYIAAGEEELVITETVTTSALTQMTETTTAATTTEATTAAETTAETTESMVSETETAWSPPTVDELDYEKAFFDNFLFIGDSISTGLSGYNFLPVNNVFAKQGFTPNNIPDKEIDGFTVTGKAADMKPDTIVIMLGTNGLSYIDTGVMATAYGKLIDSLKTASPDSRIVILSIPPVTAKHEAEKPENLTVINDYNDKLKTLADEKDAVFIDINAILAAEDGYTADIYAEADGLHLKGEAYKRILSEIEENLS